MAARLCRLELGLYFERAPNTQLSRRMTRSVDETESQMGKTSQRSYSFGYFLISLIVLFHSIRFLVFNKTISLIEKGAFSIGKFSIYNNFISVHYIQVYQNLYIATEAFVS